MECGQRGQYGHLALRVAELVLNCEIECAAILLQVEMARLALVQHPKFVNALLSRV